MLDLKIPLNIEPAAIGILQEHCNLVLRRSMSLVKQSLRYDIDNPGEARSEKFYPYGTDMARRWEILKTCEEMLCSKKTVYFVQIEVFYLLKSAIQEMTKEFDTVLQMCLDQNNCQVADQMLNNFRIANDVNRDFIKNALFNSNTWDRKVFHYLHRRKDEKSNYVLAKNDDANMLRFETPYFFMDLFLTKSMEEILDQKVKDNGIMSSLFMGENKDSTMILGQV